MDSCENNPAEDRVSKFLTEENADHVDPAFTAFKEKLAIDIWKVSPEGKRTFRRVHKHQMDCAKLAMQALIQRMPQGQSIDARELADASMAIATTLVARFAKDKLF